MRQYLRTSLVFIALLFPIGATARDATIAPAAAAAARTDPLPIPSLDAAATDYEASLVPVAREESRDDRRLMIDATRAMQREDRRAAIGALEAVAGRQGDSVAVWMQLSQAWTAHDPGNIRGLSASYIAYHRARTGDERTRALLELGDAAFAHHARLAEDVRIAEIHVERDENHETKEDLPALVARADEMLSIARRIQSRIGRSLSEEDEMARKGLRLDETPGFHLIDGRNTAAHDIPTVERRPVRWHGTVPRATECVPFSRPLQTDTDAIRKAITLVDPDTGRPVDVASGDVTVAGAEVCLHGLEVDTSYSLHFDSTLRSIGDARLPLDIDGEYGVEARWASTTFRTAVLRPRLGFEGDDYILRAGGYAKLGAVGMESADLALYRISDRSIARNVALGQFGQGLTSREVTAFDEGVAELVWTGTHAFDAEPNRRALSVIPLDDILEARRRAIADPDAPRTVFGGTLTVDAAREKGPGVGLFALVVKSAEIADGGGTRTYFNRTQPIDRRGRNETMLPTQWFVRTNIGLSFYETSEFLHVAARDLNTGAARNDLHVELVSASNRILESRDTDVNGIATFRRAMTRGTGGLAMRMAMTHSGSGSSPDFTFLSADTPPLLLDGLGLSRHSIDTRYDLYLTPERGVYRPGETIGSVAILRDRIGRPVDDPPKIALRLEDADGPVGAVQHLDAAGWRAGGRRIAVDVPASASVGTARLVARLVEEDGRSGDEIGSARIAISFFQPDTVRVEKVDNPPLRAEVAGTGEDRKLRITGGVRATYLYGVPLADGDGLPEAPANGLTGTIRARLISDGRYDGRAGQSCYRGFRFGNSARPASTTLRTLEITRATGQDEAPGDGENRQGFLRIGAEIAAPPLDRAPLKADIGVYLDDGAATQGRMTPTASVAVPRTGPMIGLHHSDGQVRALVLDPEDGAVETYIYYRIETEDIGYVWQQKNTMWQADATSLLDTLGLTRSGDIAIENGGPVVLGTGGDTGGHAGFGGHEHAPPSPDDRGCQRPTDMLDVSGLLPGRYIVTAALDSRFSGRPDADSALATYRFEIGQAEGPRPERPETFSLRLAKGDVAIGDPILAHAEALSIGKGHILVAAVKEGRVLSWQDVPLGGATDGPIRFETDPARAAPGQIDRPGLVREDWRGGVHLFATAFRAQGEGRAPNAARSVAAGHVRIFGPRRSFGLAVVEPQAEVQTRPGDGRMTFRIKATDLAPGETAHAVIGLVDDGLWRLTGFVPENPDTHFFAKRSLALTVRDLYGRMLDSTKSGGDGDFIPSDGASGLVSGGDLSFLTKEALRFENGIADVTVDLEDFVGTANLFVVAWSEHEGEARTGYVRKTYRIQSDVIMSLIAPDRLTPGDTANARLVLRTPTGEAFPGGELRLKTEVGRPGSRTDATNIRRTIRVTPGADQVPVFLPLDATLLDEGGPSEIEIGAVLDHPSSPSPIAKGTWTVTVGPPPGESIAFLTSLGTAQTGERLVIDLSDRKGGGGIVLEEIVLDALSPTPSARTVAWEAPRDFPSAAAEAVFGIADLIASRPPKAADGGLGALIALRGEERALSDGRNGDSGPLLRRIWRSAAALDVALALREMKRVDDADVIHTAIGELTGLVRRYDVPDFCRRELYFAAIVLARSDALDEAILPKLEACTGRDPRDAVTAGLLAAALGASGGNGAKGAVDRAIDLFAEDPPEGMRDAAIAAAMIVENGIDSDRAARFVRTATAPPADGMAELDREAAAWLSRAHAGLVRMFDGDPLDLDTLGLDPRTLSAAPQDDGTIRIDLTTAAIPDRIAFANGGETPIHAVGRYRLSPAALEKRGGELEFTTDLHRSEGTEYVSARTLAVREKGLFILEVDTELSEEERVRAIIQVPPGMELIARPYSRRLANDLQLVGTIDEVIHEPGRTVMQLRADKAGALRLAFAVTPVVDGTFTWPGAILTGVDTGTGWSAAFEVRVTPPSDAR